MSSSPPRSISDRLTSPAAILVLAATLRLLFMVFLGNRTYWADTLEYEKTAMQFLSGQGPEGGTPRAPLYPLLMASGFRLGGVGNYQMIRVLQIILSIALIHLAGRLAFGFAGAQVQRMTMLALAISPTMVFAANMLYPTALYSALILTLTWSAWQLSQRRSPRNGLILGAAVALGWLTDQVFIAPASGVILCLLFGFRHRTARLVSGLSLALMVAACLAVPYLLWQRAAYGGKAIFMQKAQYVLHWSRSDSLMSSTRAVRMPRGGEFRPLGAGEFMKREWALVRTQPVAYVHDVGFEFAHFFAPLPDRVQTQNRFNRGPILWLGALFTTPLLLLALLGLIHGPAARRDRWLLGCVVFATAAFYALFFTQTRYRIPVEPQISLLAALGFERLVSGKRNPSS